MKKIKNIVTTKEHFNLFKTEAKKWIDRFELNEWDILFINEKISNGALANISRNLLGKNVTIRLNSKWNMYGIDNIKEEIKITAKHEAIHLLLSTISELAKTRFTSLDEITMTEEGLVRKLEKIII